MQDIQQIKEKVIYDLDKLSSVFNEELDDYFMKVQDLYHSLQKTQYTRDREYQYAKLQEIKARQIKYENNMQHIQLIQQNLSNQILIDLHNRIDQNILNKFESALDSDEEP